MPDSGLSVPVRKRLALAVIAALLYGLILYLMIWVGMGIDEMILPVISGLILMPMAIASIAKILADPRGAEPIGGHILVGLGIIMVLVIISMAFFGEGGICAVMAAPFLAAGSVLGTILTHNLLRWYNARKTTVFMIALPLLVLPLEPHLSHADHYGSVTSVVEIEAPPATVWRHTVEIPGIARDELPFSISHDIIGVPRPENAALEGSGPGAVRHLRWSEGVRFQEIVTAWEQDRYLAWDFRFDQDAIPASVEGHIDIDSPYLGISNGNYTLEPLPGGRTRLTLTTEYRIATPINAYCDWWGQVFLGDFHSAVLQVIKHRSETDAAQDSGRPI
ncbi:SRPBCC family protein [Paracoccus onubensis]|uniref:SRPBCC family protein n=1 Tax=Paracoccus onubensis TaxID=1675788 RepID=A0A418SWG0_9RHOB|nr:SRPBCC family protein [Paracoccus onubensis]RJE85260.1 SRPBCC family protein [Paracoccus onubensis]